MHAIKNSDFSGRNACLGDLANNPVADIVPDSGRHETIKVGIVVPTYNRVAMLRAAVDSILAQTYANLDVIILDDCSTDETAQYLATLSDPRFSYVVNEENLQLAGTINKGIALLSRDTPWCTVLCDDDLFDEHCIEQFVRAVRGKNVRSVVHSHIRFVAEDGTFVRDGRCAPEEESALQFVASRASFVRDRYLSGIFFSRNYCNDIGGYPCFASGMAADDAFVFALALHDRLVYASEAVVKIRLHGCAESQQIDESGRHLLALHEYCNFCRKFAASSRLMGPSDRKLLERYMRSFVLAHNEHLWGNCMGRYLHDDRALGRLMRKRLYGFGADPRFYFPPHVRLASYCGLLTGICLLRSHWYMKWVQKLQKYFKKRPDF
jgi:glycosyltransferase involved in cell wall biosynthesis